MGLRNKTELRRKTWIKRSAKRLPRGGGITRGTPIAKRGKRGRRFRLSEPNLPLRQWIRSLPCLVSGCRRRRCDPHHVQSRGAGGRDEGNLVPLCRWHHDEHDAMGRRSFAMKYGLDLPAAAARLWHAYQEEER